MARFFNTRRFFLSGKNKISILNPCSSCSTIVCTTFYRLAVLGLLCLLTRLLLHMHATVAPPTLATRIFCIVSTDDNRHNSAAVHVKRTWAKHCDGFLVVSNDAHEELEPAVFQHLSDKWDKMRAHFEYVYNYHFDESDWFLFANDDNFVVVENLRQMLQSHNPKELIYFGCKLRSVTNQTYMYDHSGMVLSSAALQQFVLKALSNETICSSKPQGSAATEELGRCLSNVNVLAGDSRDQLGYHRFLPFEMKDHLVGRLNASLELPKLLLERSYYEVANLNVPVSMRVICSKLEYMPYIYNLYYLTYKVNIFGMDRVNGIEAHQQIKEI